MKDVPPSVINEQQQSQTIYPKTEALADEITSQPSKKLRKKMLRDKTLIPKNNDYSEYNQIVGKIAIQYKDARALVNDTKVLLNEVPNEEISSLVESLEKDLDKIHDRVDYVSTAFNGVKGSGTKNLQQRLKVIQLAENAQDLSNKILHSVLPTALELSEKVVGYVEKIEEELNNVPEQ